MKHGRRHKTLKEQAYIARQDAPGYKTPYPPIDVAMPTKREPVAPVEDAPFPTRPSTQDKKRPRQLGLTPHDEPP